MPLGLRCSGASTRNSKMAGIIIPVTAKPRPFNRRLLMQIKNILIMLHIGAINIGATEKIISTIIPAEEPLDKIA